MISVCIPTYEMNGRGVEFLKQILVSLTNQTFKNFEVVISDHSVTDQIKNSLLEYNNVLNIKYIRNEFKRGSSSANINRAIAESSYDIIKPIFQDDYIYSPRCLEHIVQANAPWGASQFIHTNENKSSLYNPMTPVLTNQTVHGINTFGCPSVMFFKKNSETYFDENLIWLMDCEFYYRLWKQYGLPTVIPSIDVCVRVWNDSVSGHVSSDVKDKEYQYVRTKHGI